MLEMGFLEVGLLPSWHWPLQTFPGLPHTNHIHPGPVLGQPKLQAVEDIRSDLLGGDFRVLVQRCRQDLILEPLKRHLDSTKLRMAHKRHEMEFSSINP